MVKTRNYFLSTKIMMLFTCLFMALVLCPKTVSAADIIRDWGMSTTTANFYGRKGDDRIQKGDKLTLTINNKSYASKYVKVIWQMDGIEKGQFDIRQAESVAALPDPPDESWVENGTKEIVYDIPANKSIVIETFFYQKPNTTGGSNSAKLVLDAMIVDSSSGGSGTGGSGIGSSGTGGSGTGDSSTGDSSTGGSGTGGSGTGGTGTGGTGASISGDVVTLETGNKFTLDKPATVTVKTSVNCGDLWDVWSDAGSGRNLTFGNDDDTKTVKLPAGSYKINTYSGFSSTTKFTVTKQDFNFGNIKVTLSTNYKTFTVEYIPAAGTLPEDSAATYIEKWNFSYSSNGRNSGFIDGKLKKYTQTIPCPPDTPGWYTLTFTIRNENYGSSYFTCEKSVTIPQIPVTPSYRADYMTNVTYNSATFANLPSPSCGAYSIVQVYENGKWKDKTVGRAWGSAKLTGLKPNTTYRCRLRGKQVCAPQNILSYPSNVFTFRTGVNVKPAIKSVKISKAKVSKVPYKPATGYYDTFGRWHRVAASGGYYVTSYKITVTLKKRVAGPTGLCINGKYVKGSGKKYTVTVSGKGKLIGKKASVNVKYANHPSYGGYSPAITKKVKIKK